MLNRGLLVQFSCCVVVFAEDNGEFTTRIAQYRCPIDSLDALQKEGTTSASSIGKGLMLGKTIRVPRHVGLSEPVARQTGPPLRRVFAKAYVAVVGTGGTWVLTVKDAVNRHPLTAYYFVHRGKCNFFLCRSIEVALI